jgi:hypothetical protein
MKLGLIGRDENIPSEDVVSVCLRPQVRRNVLGLIVTDLCASQDSFGIMSVEHRNKATA